MAGVTPEGFQTKRLPEILNDLVESEQVNIDPDINTNDDELLGQINNVFAQITSEVWDLAQAVNDNFNVLSAEGTNLDDLAALVGISRQQATRSFTSDQWYVGSSGTLIETTLILENPSTGDRFSPVNAFTIDKAACIGATYSLDTVLNNTLYRVTVNSVDYDYTSDANATAFEILSNLASLISATTGITGVFDNVQETLTVLSDDSTTTFSIDIPNYFSNGVITVRGLTAAQEAGPIQAPANSVTDIVLGTSGLTSTTNTLAYSVGREEETDEELRARILTSQSVRGTATVDAISDGLMNVEGVTNVVVYENDTFAVDGAGRPPKSFEAYVEGGTDQAIGESIWSNKAAGIEAFGDVDVTVQDITGVLRTVSFSRPVQIVLASASAEYDVVPDGYTQLQFEAAVAQNMFDYLNGLDVGEDVVPSRMYCPLYAEFANVVFSNVLVNGSANTIVIEPNQVASIDLNDITVTQA